MTEVQRGKLSATTVRRLSVRTEMPTPSNSPPLRPRASREQFAWFVSLPKQGKPHTKKAYVICGACVCNLSMYTYVCVQCIQIVESSNFRKLLKDDM